MSDARPERSRAQVSQALIFSFRTSQKVRTRGASRIKDTVWNGFFERSETHEKGERDRFTNQGRQAWADRRTYRRTQERRERERVKGELKQERREMMGRGGRREELTREGETQNTKGCREKRNDKRVLPNPTTSSRDTHTREQRRPTTPETRPHEIRRSRHSV